MTTPLDLIVLPLARRSGHDQSELPGLYAATAPRRAARGRSLDRLVIYLALEGTAPLSSRGATRLMEHLVEIYYKTGGSSTAAMRTVAEWLNEYLLERNLRGASRAMQSVGLFTLAVLRGNRLNLAQSGPTHAFLITAGGSQHFHDPNIAGRGLGLGRATAIRYYQAELSPQDVLLVSARPPLGWTTATLDGLHGLSLGNLHRHLIHQVGPELEAALVQVQAGSGKLRVLRPEPVREKQTPPGVESKIPGETSPSKPTPFPRPPEPEIPVGAAPLERVRPPRTESPSSGPHLPVISVESPEKDTKPPKEKPQRSPVIGPALLRVGQAVGVTLRQSSQAAGRMIKRILPDESLFSIPAAWMAFIAVAVPLIVVAVAASVYFKRGQGKMYEEYYLQAQYAAEQASQLEDANALRAGWDTVLTYLDQAEVYQVTENSQAMRNYAQNVLDILDNVERLAFQPAIMGGLPVDVLVKRIVVTEDGNELYLLNGTDGHVLRATLTAQGYSLDPDFICEPVPEPLIVGPLVDIIALPLGDSNNAVIMGMDANGNLMECIPGGQPPLAFQMPPPDMNWGTPTAFVMDSTNLYVLDPITNAVWIFWGNDGYEERPQLFFDEQIPPMGDVIDLTVNREDLFLLHADGHLTTCTFGYPTRCTDPATINDLREGRESGPTIDKAVFSEIQFAPPPDPSLYLLEPEQGAIYHFSMRLTYQRQYRSQTPLPDGPATAFTISPEHQVFIAIGNQVYLATLP